MVCDDRLIEWDAPPRRSASSIVDDRILTSCAVVCARMDGWWTLAAGNPHVTSVSPREEELADGPGVLTPKPVLMDRSPDPPSAFVAARSMSNLRLEDLRTMHPYPVATDRYPRKAVVG
jgi:hypothetical protein